MENVKGIITMKHEKDNLTANEKNKIDNVRKLENEKANLLLLRKQSKNNSERFNFTKNDE